MPDLGWVVAESGLGAARIIGDRYRDRGRLPFLDRAAVPWLAAAERAADEVGEEVRRELAGCGALPTSSELSRLSVRTEGAWRLLPLVHRRRRLRTLGRLAATARLLGRARGVRAADVAVLDARSSIAPHRGNNWGVVRAHLTLREPPGDEVCELRFPELGAAQRWRQGAAFAFDDLELHEAVNHRSSARVVLLVELDRPLPAGPAALNRLAQRLYRHHPVQRAVDLDRFNVSTTLVPPPSAGGCRDQR